ncbi:DUF7504 family protein [Halosimplex salinum]|uniref:DUF7504 family protein n=1 Tax=Halosimplex salinum TaxID=1710538 RepID=UPI000F46BE61|nr:hypothetical protein [Halosimplex salinum]
MSTTPDEDRGSTEMPSNVLLLAPSIGEQGDEVCRELLHGTGQRHHRLIVTCMESPRQRLAACADHEHAGEVTVVDVETAARSAVAASADSAGPTDAVVEHAPAETDLVGLGDVIDRHLTRLSAEGETAVCFHSVTALLQRADEPAVFKFLEVLTSTVERADAVAHYHVNPDVHDPETVRTFEVLFDSVVDLRTANVADE